MLNEKSNFYEINQNKKEFIKINGRNYGIDLLRIFSMINIINLHINLFSRQLFINILSPKYKQIWRLEVYSYPAVNCFGLISGIVGYKKYKFSNLIYIWLTVFFYSISISIYLFIVKEIGINKKMLFLSLFPILIKRHWYVNAYFSMYFLLPFINFGIYYLNREFHRNIIIFFIIFYSIYNIIAKILCLYSDFNFLNNGYSSMWLILLYIIGAFFGKHINMNKYKYNTIIPSFFLIFLFATLFSSEFYFKLIKLKSKLEKKLFISYISPTIVMQAIALTMIFSKLKIKNKFLIKIISFLTPLNFSVQLIHARFFQTKVKIIKILFNWVIKFNAKNLFFKIYAVGIIVYFFCIFIDYIRFLIFKLLKIRDFALFIEKVIPKILNII